MNDGDRPNPDALLAALQTEAARIQRGRLKVFLGMCPGVGKTYAMLEAAQRELKNGRDLVIGYVETHGRKETDALAVGIPRRAAHAASNIAASRSRKWIWTPCSRAGRSSRWWMNSRTPTRPARAIPNAGRT